jgi:hypothetical protein
MPCDAGNRDGEMLIGRHYRIVAVNLLCKHMSPVAGVSVGSPSYAG